MDVIIDKLNILQCPFNFDKKEIINEKWKDLLCWLIHKYDPGYYNTYLRDNTRISNILQALSLIGICSPNDHQFISGNIPQQLKISSLQYFLDIILYSQSNSEEMIDQNYKRDKKLLNTVQSNWPLIFNKQLQLFPADMKPIYSKGQKIFSVQSLNKDKQEIEKRIKELKDQIEKYSTTISKDNENQQKSPKILLTQQFQHLQSLLSEFSNTYTTCFSPWNNESNEKFLEIGEPTREVNNLSKIYIDLISSIHNVKTLYEELINSNLEDIENSSSLRDQHVKSLEESISILEKSLLRYKETENVLNNEI